jgi:uncharacterized repeat protein (TIGR02543 family)
MKVGTSDVIRLYKRGYVLSTNPGGVVLAADSDPTGQACVLNEYVYWNGNYYKCVQTEATEMKDGSNNMMHRRTTITFNANGGTGGSSQVRTWNVENVTQPSNPSRTGYTFQGWATTSGASTPNVTFPFIAPQNNTTYYAVWEQNAAPTANPSIYDMSTTTFKYRVRNNDASYATIYAEHSDSTPDVSRGSIAPGGYTSTIDTGTSTMLGGGYTIYAKAQASGKDPSSVVSLYIGT